MARSASAARPGCYAAALIIVLAAATLVLYRLGGLGLIQNHLALAPPPPSLHTGHAASVAMSMTPSLVRKRESVCVCVWESACARV